MEKKCLVLTQDGRSRHGIRSDWLSEGARSETQFPTYDVVVLLGHIRQSIHAAKRDLNHRWLLNIN